MVSQSTTEVVAKCEESIFVIYTFDDEGNAKGLGTGFFVSSTGEGITNYHVLEGASKAIIKLSNGNLYQIEEVVASDKNFDLAKFRIQGDNTKFKPLQLITARAQKGSKIIVIGNPEGFEGSVSEGIISSYREIEGFGSVVQITAPISQGSSGSPILNTDGNVIGVATFVYKDGQNINFGVSSEKILGLSGNFDLLLKKSEFVLINQEPENEAGLTYKAIEFFKDKTLLHCNITNVQCGYGEKVGIFAALNKADKGFYIRDPKTNNKYYIRKSSIGSNRDNMTFIPLGETINFWLEFEPAPFTLDKFDIIEGSGNSNWSVFGVSLKTYNTNISNYFRSLGLKKLTEKKYEEAISLFKENLKQNPYDDKTLNLLGIAAHLMYNDYDAIKYFDGAIALNSKMDTYYFNKYKIYFDRNEFEKAIECLNLAIIANSSQPDYFWLRAGLYTKIKNYQSAKSDYDIGIAKGELNFGKDSKQLASLLVARGDCNAYLKDFTSACNDYNRAYQIDEHEVIKSRISKMCKSEMKFDSRFGYVCFFSTWGNGGDLKLYVDNVFEGKLTSYFKSGTYPECGQEGGITVIREPGVYKYEVKDEAGNKWKGKIEFKAGICLKQGLSNN